MQVLRMMNMMKMKKLAALLAVLCLLVGCMVGCGKEAAPTRMCGATDARHLYKIGVPVYVSGLNGSGAHSVEEKLNLDSIDMGVAMIHELI